MLTRPESLWDDDRSPAPAAVAAPDVELDRPATEEHRWRSQTVTAPIEQMVRAGAHAGDIEDRFADRYDLRRLGHRAIDAVVASMGIARELTDTELIAGLAASAARMAPEAGQDEWQAVAEFVYAHLMNAPDEFAKFSYTGIDPDGRRCRDDDRQPDCRASGHGGLRRQMGRNRTGAWAVRPLGRTLGPGR